MRPTIPATIITAITLILVLFFLFFYAFQLLPYHGGDEALHAQHRAVMHYLLVPVIEIEGLEFMSDAERAHMRDVKGLFDIAWFLMLFFLALTFIIVRYLKRQELYAALRKTGWSLLGFVCVAFLFSSSGFSRAWDLMHLVLFPQGNWQFAAESALITLYPPSFFLWYSIIYLGLLVITGALLFLVRPENVK